MTHSYLVRSIDMHSYHSKIFLDGVGGPFNSVDFEVVQDE